MSCTICRTYRKIKYHSLIYKFKLWWILNITLRKKEKEEDTFLIIEE
jgi:hypothetical protein